MVERIDIVVAERGSRTVRRNLDDIGDGADRTRARMDLLRRSFAALGGALALQQAFSQISEFQTAIAEVATLVDTATFNIEGLTQAALDQARAFGGSPTGQAQAFYQVISAGAGSAAEATDILTTANRLAVAGVTDVETAADGLISVLNAYGLEATEAGRVSDILFGTVRAGRTTVDELSSALGRVTPIAAAAGVGFDEVGAAIAALTSGGVNTNEAVTGVRAVIASIIRPTQEATDAANALGLEFSAAALQSQGLQEFLTGVIGATGGSTDALSQLFTGVESLAPVLALAGEAGETFAETLQRLREDANVTDEAFQKVAETFEFQFGRVTAGLQAELIQAGSSIVSNFVPALTILADNLDVVTNVIEAVVILIGVQLARQAIPAAIAGFRALGVAIAANPIGAIVAVLSVAIALLVAFSDQITVTGNGITTLADVGVATFTTLRDAVITLATVFEDTFGTAQQSAEDAGEGIQVTFQEVLVFIAQIIDGVVGVFAGLGAAVGVIIANLAAAIVEGFVGAFNAVAGIVRDFANGVVNILNPIRETLGLSTLGAIQDLSIRGPRASRQVGSDIAGAFQEGFNNVNVAEGFVNEVFDRANARAQARELVGEATAGNTAQTIANTEALRENAAASEAAGSASSESVTSFAQATESLREQNLLLQQNGLARDILREQLQAQSQVERRLSTQEQATIATLVTQNAALQEQGDVLESLRGPQQGLEARLAAIETLYSSGQITIAEYNRALADTQPQVVQALEQEQLLLTTNVAQREVLSAVLAAEQELRRELTETERAQIENLILLNQELRNEDQILQDLQGPLSDLLVRQDALDSLFAQGRISLDQYNSAVRELNVELTSLDNTIGGGIENGLARIAAQANDLGSSISDVVVGAFDDATNAIVDFVTTGTFSIRGFVSNILTELIRLNTQSLLGGLFGGGGGGGGGIFGSLLGGLFGGGLPGFQNGGQFTVGAATSVSRIPGVDNRLVAFRAQDGEDVTITPRNQTPAGSGAPMVNQTFNITTPDSDSFQQSRTQIANRQNAGLQRARLRR